MQAVQYTAFGQRPELVEVEKPVRGRAVVVPGAAGASRRTSPKSGS
jgi:hypothetical protein